MEEKIENNVFLVDKNTEDIYSECYESVKNIIEKYKDNIINIIWLIQITIGMILHHYAQ